ncbi:hypothetical protein SFRURICE_005893 [Spodoptera frugiperda]|nr:hypothetical protein SFRURICE_005893 [Spodoptera frugiperda]
MPLGKSPRMVDTFSSEGASYGTPQQNSWRTARLTRDARESLRGSPPASSSSDYNHNNTLPRPSTIQAAALLPTQPWPTSEISDALEPSPAGMGCIGCNAGVAIISVF